MKFIIVTIFLIILTTSHCGFSEIDFNDPTSALSMPGITEDEPSILEQAPENQESEQRFLEKSSFSQSDYSYDNSERLNANNDEQNEFNEDLPGYIDGKERIGNRNNNNPSYRFIQNKMKAKNPHFFYNSPNSKEPGKDSVQIRKEGLSNGVVLDKGKRILNFETGQFPEFFFDLRIEK